MKIAVNTRLMLKHRMDGIGWFEYETMRRIVAQHPQHEFHFLFDRPWNEDFVFGPNVIPHALMPQARRPFLMRLWNDYAVPMALKRIRPDLYVSPDAQASLRTKIPQLVVIHDINFEHYPEDLPGIYSRYLRKYSRRFAEHADRIATVSEFSKQDISRQYHVSPDKIDVVYNGVNEGFYPLSASQKEEAKQKYSGGKPFFVFVGTIHPRKNLQRLIPAFDRFIERTGADVNLVVVGNAFFLNEELRTAMSGMKHPQRLIMVGRLDADDLHNAVGASLANVYISYFEGFGIPILEGFQCGVPVITSNVTSMPEVASDAALLVDPFSVESISAALESIYASPKLAQDLVEKGKKRMEDFSWDRTSVLLWDSIQKTMHGKA